MSSVWLLELAAVAEQSASSPRVVAREPPGARGRTAHRRSRARCASTPERLFCVAPCARSVVPSRAERDARRSKCSLAVDLFQTSSASLATQLHGRLEVAPRRAGAPRACRARPRRSRVLTEDLAHRCRAGPRTRSARGRATRGRRLIASTSCSESLIPERSASARARRKPAVVPARPSASTTAASNDSRHDCAFRLRRANLRARYSAPGRAGLDRSVSRCRSTSSAKADGGLVATRAVLLERLHHDPVEVAAEVPARASFASLLRCLAICSAVRAQLADHACWASAARPRGSCASSPRRPRCADPSGQPGVVPVSSSYSSTPSE